MSTFVIDAPVAIDFAANGVTVPPMHSLAAPTLMRSQVLALVYESVRRGEIDERTGRKVLDGVRALRIRLLGDRSLQDHAWRIAAELDWPNTYRAEYIALTQLQGDALATADEELASAASRFVQTVAVADILGS
ncbi:MAG: type II toxin-antitoxin system VapC family toxin [Dietzia sp.]|nr:type II toxin-antitoxin system VapC family toxin [Dietzia sp.]